MQSSSDQPAVLKIGLPGSANIASEGKIYQLATGKGYADLLGLDVDRNTLLLEKLGATLAERRLPVQAQIELICDALQRSWIEVPAQEELMTGAEKADWHINFLKGKYQQAEAGISPQVFHRAIDFAEERKANFSPKKCSSGTW